MEVDNRSDHGEVKDIRAAHHEGRDVEKVVHADGTVDYIDARAIGGDVEDMPAGYYTSLPFVMTLIAQCLASICAYTGWVLPANTLLLINAALDNSPNIGWVATIWTLGSAIGFLLVGRFSDLFGRRWMVLGTTVLGLIGTIIGSCAQNVTMLIVANGANGIAAAGQLSFGIVMGELVPNKHRGLIVTIVFASSLPFAVFGPIIARSFINNTSSGWRWSYFLGDIFGAITLVLYYFFYHPPRYDQLHVGGKTKWQAVKEMDFGGIFFFIAGSVLFLVGLSWGGVTYPWASGPVLGTLIGGIATLAMFVIYEGFFCPVTPLMPPRLFRNIGFVGLVALGSIGAMVYYSMTVLWPTIIGTYTTDVMRIGWESSVVGGGILLGQIMGGLAIGYVPKVKWQCIIASCMALSFLTPISTINAYNHSTILALGVMALVSVGYVENITFPGVTLVWEAQDIGLATGTMGSIRAMAGAIAQALYVNVFTNKLTENIPAMVPQAAVAAGLPQSSLPQLFAGLTAGNFTAVPGINPSIISAVGTSMQAAQHDALKLVFYCTIPFSVLLIGASCLVPNMEKFLHSNVAKKLQKNDAESGGLRSEKVVDERRASPPAGTQTTATAS